MQNSLPAKFFLVIPVILYFLFFAGCGKPSHRQDKSGDLDRQTEERILHQARVDYKEGRDAQVIKELNRFLSVHSHSPKEREARWILAQSYERSGKLRAALKHYKIISQGLPPGQEQKEVHQRIDELNQRLKEVGSELQAIEAVRVSLNQLSLIRNDSGTPKRLSQEGVMSVLIDFGCPEKVMPQPQNAVKTSDVSPQAQLSSSVAEVHRRGLRALVGINLRCLGYLDSRSNKQWLDGSYNPVTRKVQLSPYFDIFHPQYQKLMADEIKRLADSGIDGVVFLAEVPLGLYDGLTPGSVDMFNKTFHTRMSPQTLFQNGVNHGSSPSSSDRNQHFNPSASEASEFWRWTGWKTRQRLLVLQGLMDQVHEEKPGFPFGLELHPESIQDPLGALTQFSEDFLEANQKSFTFFLITPRSGRKIQSESNSPSSNDLEGFINESRTLVDRMRLVIQNPARIWLSIPWGKKTPPTLGSESPHARHLQKVSRIYELETFLDK